MIFVAIYDFVASNSEEVSLNAGDFMTIVDASDPDWSLVTVKSNFDAPTGLVPKTYIEPAQPKYSVVALYDYALQSAEEVDITEGEKFNVFLDDDPDWFWGTNSRNEDGLAPKNYFSTDSGPAPAVVGEDADASAQKNKLMSALDGFGFAAAGPRKSVSEPRLELISYLVTEIDKKKKKKGFLGVGEDYIVSFVEEKSKKSLYQYHIKDVTFSEKKSKKFIVNISQNGAVETKEYEGDKSDIQGLVAQFTQCQALYEKTLGSPKQEAARHDIPAQFVMPVQVPKMENSKVESQKQQSPPKIVVALYDYNAADNQELSIVENENLLVMDDSDPDWWMVRSMKKGGKEGFVPKTYVQQKPGDLADNSKNLSHQASAISPEEDRQSENDRIREREEAEAIAKEEAERMRNWKELEEQRIRWENERFQQEAEEERLRQQAEEERYRQLEEEDRLRKEQERQRSSLRDAMTAQTAPGPPPIAVRPEVAPPPIASRPDIGPPPIASRPEIAPPPIASRPELAPPPIASRPQLAPPPIASRPEIGPPPIASRPELAPPPIASRPDVGPPPIASRPELAPPPIASRPDVGPPSIASRPEIAPPPIASRPQIVPPELASRPEIHPSPIASRPSITSRPTFVPPIFARPEVAPTIPSRPSTEVLGTTYKNETSASQPESEVREWTDKTGTFKVKALFVSVKDNKVHLRKDGSGGKITIQLEKLHPNDIEYIRSISGYEHVEMAAPLAQKIPIPQTRKVSHVDSNILAQAAAIKLSDPPSSSFIYNGFDWKSWLMKAGVSPGDSITYGQKFCAEKLDSSSISSLDRDLLRALGVSEGDIIRIKRAVVDSISVDASSSAARELEAQNRNLEKIRKVSGGLNSQKQEQIESDEAFARRLQFQEIQGQTKPKAPKSFSSNAIDLNAIKDASAILEASNHSTQNAPSVLRKSVTVNKNPPAFSTLPSTEEAITNSLGIKEKESSSKHNPWSIPGQEAKVPQASAPVQNISVPAMVPSRRNTPTSQQPPAVPVRPTFGNPTMMTQGEQESLTKTQMQQKEAQLALQRAQYDLKLAQEQAKQAAIIQEQTKRAKAQEEESAIALAKAQEAARQAAMMKEQAERALRAAQAGMINPAPSQNSQMGPYGGHVMPGNFGTSNNFNLPMSAPAPNTFVGAMPNQPVISNRPYQMPGAPSGMMTGPSGAFAPPNMSSSGGFPRPGLQAPLIPVGNPVHNLARPIARSNTSESKNAAPVNNDPYAVFRSSDVNEPSIFTSQSAGMQNQPAQYYGQTNMPYGQNPSFLPQSSTPNFVPAQYQGQNLSQYGNMASQNGFPAVQFPNMPQNQVPGNYANNGPQYINNQLSNQSQMPSVNYQNSARPNFMPPYNATGNQGYNR